MRVTLDIPDELYSVNMGREYLADHAFESDYPFGLPTDYWPAKRGKIALKDMTVSNKPPATPWL